MKKKMKKTMRLLVVFMLLLCLAIPSTVSVFADDANLTTDAQQTSVQSSDEEIKTEGDVVMDGVNGTGGSTNTGNYENETVMLYTEGNTIVYDGSDNIYAMNIFVNIAAFASFQFELVVPDYIRIEDVETGDNLMQHEYSSFNSTVFDDGRYARITYSNPEDLHVSGYDVKVLARVTYSVRYGGNYEQEPWLNDYLFTNSNAEEVYVEPSIKPIIITTGAEQIFMKGDVDYNGVVDFKDLMIIQHRITNNEYFYGEDFDRANIDNNGDVNIKDCQYIQMYLVGKISSLDGINGDGNNQETFSVSIYYVFIEDDGRYVKGEIAVTVTSGMSIGRVVENNIMGYEGFSYIGAFYELDLCNHVDESQTVTPGMYIYLGYSRDYTESYYNTHITFICDGIIMEEGSVYIESGENIYDTVKALVTEMTDGNEMATIDGLYSDADLTTPYPQNTVMYDGEYAYVYVKLVSVSIVGTYELYSEVKYETEDGSTICDRTRIGTVTFNANGGQYIDADNNTYQFNSYKNVSGEVICYIGDYSMMAIEIMSLPTADGGNGTALFEFVFDGDDLEPSDEFALVAGKYNLNVYGYEYIIELCDNGVAKITFMGATAYCEYTVDGNNIVIDPTGEIMGGALPLIYDAETQTIAVNFDAMGNGGAVEDIPANGTVENGEYVEQL